MTKFVLISAAVTCGLLTPAAAFAGTSNAKMPVTAAVASTCAVLATPLAFGDLSLSGGNTDAKAEIKLTCTPGVKYQVGLDKGANAKDGVRHMLGTVGGSTIPYAVYSDAARSVAWGNTNGIDTVDGTAAAVVTDLTVYGRVASTPSLFTAGGYTDTVTVTVTF